MPGPEGLRRFALSPVAETPAPSEIDNTGLQHRAALEQISLTLSCASCLEVCFDLFQSLVLGLG